MFNVVRLCFRNKDCAHLGCYPIFKSSKIKHETKALESKNKYRLDE